MAVASTIRQHLRVKKWGFFSRYGQKQSQEVFVKDLVGEENLRA